MPGGIGTGPSNSFWSKMGQMAPGALSSLAGSYGDPEIMSPSPMGGGMGMKKRGASMPGMDSMPPPNSMGSMGGMSPGMGGPMSGPPPMPPRMPQSGGMIAPPQLQMSDPNMGGGMGGMPPNNPMPSLPNHMGGYQPGGMEGQNNRFWDIYQGLMNRGGGGRGMMG